jgi:hypothetical protein
MDTGAFNQQVNQSEHEAGKKKNFQNGAKE